MRTPAALVCVGMLTTRRVVRQADMVHTLSDYCRRISLDLSKVVPESFTLGGPREDRTQRRRLCAAHERHVAATGRAVWILKPTGGGKGGNIFLQDECVLCPRALPQLQHHTRSHRLHQRVHASSLNEVLRHLDSRAGLSTEWVVQRYIDRPLLLRGKRKFDMRLWVLLDHNYHMYLYKQGVLRTGSTPFTMDDLDDRFVHLSNHCIQASCGPWQAEGWLCVCLCAVTVQVLALYTDEAPRLRQVRTHQ